MSSRDASDPRLLLPEWLRDGDAPLPSPIEAPASKAAVAVLEYVPVAAEVQSGTAEQITRTISPVSERLTIDTRLDPAVLVSAEDLPAWLGGLQRPGVIDATPSISLRLPETVVDVSVEELEPYEGVDAPADGVLDVQVNGWYLIVAAIGLLILLAAALRLYLS